MKLHNYVQGCSDTLDDDKVQCKDGEGCSERKKAAKRKKGTIVADNDNSEANETEGKPPAVAAAVVCSANATSEGGDDNNDNDDNDNNDNNDDNDHNDEDSVEIEHAKKSGDG